jgi:cysteine protease ATG4
MSSVSSIFRTVSSSEGAMLVTGPECESSTIDASKAMDDAIRVTSCRCEPVDVGGNEQAASQVRNNPLMKFLGSTLNLIGPKQSGDETELEEMDERKGIVKILEPADKREVVGGYDVCREFSYSTDEDDKPVQRGRNRNGGVLRLFAGDDSYLVSSNNCVDDATEEGTLQTYVLGKIYDPIKDYAARRDDESSLFWLTYRCDFPEIKPYGIQSDAGWGCMLRSAQMLMGQVLRLHFKSRDWRPSQAFSRRRQDPFLRSVLTWLADFPSTNECVYSLHNMVAAGLSYDKLPGEWYGPGTACYVLRDLAQMHERQQETGAIRLDRKLFRVHVASQSAVYRDEIRKLMTRDSQARFDEDKKKKEAEAPPASHPLDLAWEEELVEKVGKVEWDTSLLLLIPLRLGLKGFNADYLKVVTHTFSFPQSVGVLGGVIRGARWFYGAVSDGSNVFGLDPHTVQNPPRRRSALVNGKASSVVDLTDDYLRSVHTTYHDTLSLLRMDPSIALGFYCRTELDLEQVFSGLQTWKEEHGELPELFTVADASPDYSSNISSVMSDMMLSGTVSVLDGIDDSDASEEDEYVVL